MEFRASGRSVLEGRQRLGEGFGEVAVGQAGVEGGAGAGGHVEAAGGAAALRELAGVDLKIAGSRDLSGQDAWGVGGLGGGGGWGVGGGFRLGEVGEEGREERFGRRFGGGWEERFGGGLWKENV